MLWPRAPTDALFPYTTLFRSAPDRARPRQRGGARDHRAVRRSSPVGQSSPMYFVGVDLAWGQKQRTGLAVLDGKDRKSTRLNSSHPSISYAVFCLKKKTKHIN